MAKRTATCAIKWTSRAKARQLRPSSYLPRGAVSVSSDGRFVIKKHGREFQLLDRTTYAERNVSSVYVAKQVACAAKRQPRG